MDPYHGVSPLGHWQIANVVPEQEDERHQEMWPIYVSKHEEVAVCCCTRTEWEQMLQSCEHAKECELPTFMSQKAKDAHERRHFHITGQIVPDHFTSKRVLCDPEYQKEISYQERNNNLPLTETIKLIQQLEVVDIFESQVGIIGIFASLAQLRAAGEVAWDGIRYSPHRRLRIQVRADSREVVYKTQAARPRNGYCRRKRKEVRM